MNPFFFIKEANYVLKKGGLFVAKVPTTFPLHAEPWDYWRVSQHGIKSLLNKDSGFEVLILRELSKVAVVPSINFKDQSSKLQYAPSPQFSIVIARKISNEVLKTVELRSMENLGRYEH
jgi:hypothetical protein